jgi:CheY-like chemotaxis protein
MSKLVIIDDDPVHHFLMRYTLSNNSYFDTTTFTMDGSTVLEYMEENKSYADKLPDMIFLGLNRPTYTGWVFFDRAVEFGVLHN